MSWTDERVELLKKLWTDGLSASQVAAELGGVTRNAVIGKVHRLGLSGRAKTTTTTQRARRTRGQTARTARQTPSTPVSGANALKPDVKPQAAPQPKAKEKPEQDAVVVPISKRASILTLTENTCKWPIGDPGDGDFHFCGCRSAADSPYCEYHSEIAFQPNADRRRAKKAS